MTSTSDTMSESIAEKRFWENLSKNDEKREWLIKGLSKLINNGAAEAEKATPSTAVGQRSNGNGQNSKSFASSSRGVVSEDDDDVIVLDSDSESDSEMDAEDEEIIALVFADKPKEDAQSELDANETPPPTSIDKLREDVQPGLEDKPEQGTNSENEALVMGHTPAEDDDDEDGSESESDEDSDSGEESSETDTKSENPDWINSDAEDYVITIVDSDEEELQLPERQWLQPPRPMICHRCSCRNQKVSEFRDRKLFQFHINRHTLMEHFSCLTCRRPFVQMNLCLAHEIREHGTEIQPSCYEKNDPVILAAKDFLKRRKRNEKAPHSSDIDEVVPPSNNVIDDDHYDPDEDDGRIVGSTSFLPYRGPPVDDILECYEIQLNYSHPKSHLANGVARVAVDNHKFNVGKGHAVDRLGRFAKRHNRGKKLPWKLRPPGRASTATDDESVQSSEGPFGSRMKRVIQKNGISSRHPSASSVSVGLAAPSLSSTVGAVAVDEQSTSYPEVSSSIIPEIPEKSSNRKRKREAEPTPTAIPVPTPPASLCWSELSCINCTHAYHTDEEPIVIGLVSGTEEDAAADSAKEMESAISQSFNVESPQKTSKGKKRKRKKGLKNRQRKDDEDIPKALRSLLIVPYKPPAPLPNDSFTEKEHFLYAAGLTNNLRLDLYRNGSLTNLKLPDCFVRLERLKNGDDDM